jgi:hypothetical protein
MLQDFQNGMLATLPRAIFLSQAFNFRTNWKEAGQLPAFRL